MSSEPQVDQTAPSFDPLNPYPWFTWMRQHERVFQDPTTHLWYVFGYHDVLRVLNPPLKGSEQDPIVFSSMIPHGPERTAVQGSIILTDPPRHRAIRDLLTPAFSPKALRDHYGNRIIAIIDGLLDQIIDEETMDVVAHLAYEIPLLVICEMLGVPHNDRAAFKDWTALIAQSSRGSEQADLEASPILTRVPELEQYFLHTIEERRKLSPGESVDLISTLVHRCPQDGVMLNGEELLGNCELLLTAGFETTAHLLTNLFRVLDAFPQVQEQVWQDQTLILPLIEETLRYLSPIHLQARWTTREVELGGKVIQENQMVMPLLTSANRDEEVFPQAESFDLMRFATTPPNHVAFGFRGVHFCLGAPLARLEATLMMQRLIARVEHIRVVPETPLKPIVTDGILVPTVNGVHSLPVTFQRR